MSKIDDIIRKAEEKGIGDEVKQQILEMEHENNKLKEEKRILQIQKSESKAEQYKKSNENYRKENKKLTDKVNKLTKKKNNISSHLSREQLGVYDRMLNDFETSQTNFKISFPGEDHPIFSRFTELVNQYPNRDFIVSTIKDKVNEKLNLVDFEIKAQEKNIKILEECEKTIEENPDTWEEEVDKNTVWLHTVTNIDEIKQKIKQLKKDKQEIKKWILLKNVIQPKPTNTKTKLKNNLYYEIINEFDRIYDFCCNVGSINQYKASIRVGGFTKDELYSELTRELEKQVGLCEEPYSHNFYYSNGEGRLVPYELNRQFLQYINENTTFYQSNKSGTKYKSGNIINSDVLFNKVPLYCNKIQYRNQSLVGFNNCFYDIENDNLIKLNPQAPIMPLKNTKTELYLKSEFEIEDNPMKRIFNECFTEIDRKTLLAYIGCALFDKGYTQRQESLYIMGRGGTGKSTLTKAICSIFYNVGHQLVSKFKDSNEFGLSVFADSDVVIIDEIQSAPKNFTNRIKEISSTDDLPVEKKHFDTISIPAENVPRTFFIGNNFSQSMYEDSDSEGVRRRILIIIPLIPIQSLKYQWKDLIQPACKQWLVQEAIEEYKAQGLNKKAIPISQGLMSEAEKENRLMMCTYPERYFVQKHFEIAYFEGNTMNNEEKMAYDDLFRFTRKCIDDKMVEATCKESATNIFISIVKTALKLPQDYKTITIEGQIYFPAIIPKSEEAINYLSKEVSE